MGLQLSADVFQISQQRQALSVVRHPKTKLRSPSSDRTFNAKSLTAHRTLQHICKAHKADTHKPTLQKSCNCQRTVNRILIQADKRQ